MNAVYVGWPGRPLGRTENFGVSPVPPFRRERKRLCKPLQKVFVQDAHATSKQKSADKQASLQDHSTCSASQGARVWSRTCCPQCAPRSEPSDSRGRVVVQPWGRRDAWATGSLSRSLLLPPRAGSRAGRLLPGWAPMGPPPGPRGGGSGLFESFPGPAAGAEALRWGGGRTYAASSGGGTKGWVPSGWHPGCRSRD